MVYNSAIEPEQVNWYVLYVKPRTEKKVGERLKKIGFEVCVPTQKQLRQWSDRRKVVEMVLFPNYVFVASNQKRKNKVFEAGHVFKFVQFGGRVATLTEKEVQMVKQLGNQAKPVSIGYKGFEIGEEIEILSGSLAGYQGKVQAVKGVSKIKLALPSLHCFACVELEGVKIKKILTA